LIEHWRLSGPPVYQTVAAFVGWKPEAVKAAKGAPAQDARKVRVADDPEGFMREFAAFGGTLN
jgi:hypothetical protein